MNSDLLVTTDRERSNGVSSFGSNWGLTGELLQNLGGSGKSITGLSDGDVCERVKGRVLLLGSGMLGTKNG